MRGDLVFSAPVRMLEPIICSIPVEELSHLETQEGPITDKDLIVLEEQTAACSVQDDTNQDKDFDRDTEPIAVTEETVATEVEFVAMEDVTVALDAPTKDNAASSEDGDFVMCPAEPVPETLYPAIEELDSVPSVPAAAQQEQTTPWGVPATCFMPAEPETTEPEPITALNLPPHIHAALVCMIDMGYTNNGEWLAKLLLNKNGDINIVIDILNSRMSQ